MIAGAHLLLYSKDPEADGAFFKTAHPMLRALLYLMCDDLGNMISLLKGKGLNCATPLEAEWGVSTSVRLPSGGDIGLYQPARPTMIEARST